MSRPPARPWELDGSGVLREGARGCLGGRGRGWVGCRTRYLEGAQGKLGRGQGVLGTHDGVPGLLSTGRGRDVPPSAGGEFRGRRICLMRGSCSSVAAQGGERSAILLCLCVGCINNRVLTTTAGGKKVDAIHICACAGCLRTP